MSNRPSILAQPYVEHENVHQEAFGWYSGESPSPMEAAYHFAERVERDPPNRSLYAAALEMFLASCWNIHPEAEQRGA